MNDVLPVVVGGDGAIASTTAGSCFGFRMIVVVLVAIVDDVVVGVALFGTGRFSLGNKARL